MANWNFSLKEQTLLDQAYGIAVSLERPFEDYEVFQPIWDLGLELLPQMDSRFVLHREASKKHRRLWTVRRQERDASMGESASGTACRAVCSKVVQAMRLGGFV